MDWHIMDFLHLMQYKFSSESFIRMENRVMRLFSACWSVIKGSEI